MTGPEGHRRSLLGAAWKIVGALAVLGAVVLAVGVALPGTWSAERSVVMSAPPDSVFPWIDVVERWDRWTVWAGVESTPSGPPRGVGARRTWDDPWVGDGSFTITASEAPRRVEYEVEVEGGSMRTEGTFTLEPVDGGGTRVTWSEAGDFGWNPLMGYAALNMDRIQAAELERGLARLKALVEGEEPPS